MIKVGERIVVGEWRQYPVFVSRIYWEDRDGKETEFEALVASVVLELEWHIGDEKTASRVKLHEEGKVWYRYGNSN